MTTRTTMAIERTMAVSVARTMVADGSVSGEDDGVGYDDWDE